MGCLIVFSALWIHLSRMRKDATFAYLDNVTICGMDTEEHDRYLRRFLEAADRKKHCLQ